MGVSRGTRFLRPTDGLYLVLSGAVRILGDAGEELNVLGPGDFFGEFSLLLGTPHMHDVQVAEDAELMVIPRDTFERLLAADPELGASIRQKAERMAANVELLSRPS